MTNRQIKKIAQLSFKKNKLDGQIVAKISKALSRGELKLYIKALKNIEKNNTIFVYMPKLTGKSGMEKDFKKNFPSKKFEFKEDSSLVAGVRIVDKDDVYDFNLQNTLKNLISYVAN